MASRQPLLRKTHVTTERPPFERIALVLQGGGALGAYQGGVYQALAEANLHPDWVAGISIGAINSALIAGNPPEKRVERLQEFWDTVSSPPLGIPYFLEVKLRKRVRPQTRQPAALILHPALRRARFLQTPSATALPLSVHEHRRFELLRYCSTQSHARTPGGF
jgi:predicted acylesterase/phospholipase RssA